MKRPEQHFGKKLYDFFAVYPLETIGETIGENIEQAERALYERSDGQEGGMASVFRKSITGYDAEIYRDLHDYTVLARLVYQAAGYGDGEKSAPSEKHFTQRVKACLEKGFNDNVKTDRFLRAFDSAVSSLWDIMGRLENQGIEYMGELVTLKKDDVFKENENPLAGTLMTTMMQNEGLCFSYWKTKNSRPSAGLR